MCIDASEEAGPSTEEVFWFQNRKNVNGFERVLKLIILRDENSRLVRSSLCIRDEGTSML